MSSEAIALWTETSSDPELIAGVRAGDAAAFGVLYERHVGAARKVAAQYTNSASDVDDVVSESFSRVLRALQRGDGPDMAFRAYLFTIVRRTGMDVIDKGIRTKPREDMSPYESSLGYEAASDEPALDGFEHGMVADAFKSLPERWQAVLWYTEVEKKSPKEIAPLLGLTANGVAALAYRAREALRQAYLQQHLSTSQSMDCIEANSQLGAYVRGGLSKREHGKVDTHVRSCERCAALVSELEDVNRGMRGIIAPLFMGALGVGALEGGLPIGGAFGPQGAAGATAGAGGSGATGAATVGAGGVAAAGAGAAGIAATIGAIAQFALPAAAVVGVVALAVNGANALGFLGPDDDDAGVAGPVVVSSSPSPSASGGAGTASPSPAPTPEPTATPSVTPSVEPSAAPEELFGGGVGSGTAEGDSDQPTTIPVSSDLGTGSGSGSGSGSGQPPGTPGGSGGSGDGGVPDTGGPGGENPDPVDPVDPVDPPRGTAVLSIGQAPLNFIELSRTAPTMSMGVSNAGDGAAEAVTASISLPDGLTFAAPTSGGGAFSAPVHGDLARALSAATHTTFTAGDWECTLTEDEASVTCELDQLAAGADASLELEVALPTAALAADARTLFVLESGEQRVEYSVRTAIQVVDDELDPGYSGEGKLGVSQFGGPLLGCAITEPQCVLARQSLFTAGTGQFPSDNNNFPMVALQDDGGERVSGVTAVEIPDGATVTAAYLEWSANRSLGSSGNRGADTWDGKVREARFKVPGGAYVDVKADRSTMLNQSHRQYYIARKDVTEAVKAAGSGTYSLADIAVSASRNDHDPTYYAGFTLTVIYEDPTITGTSQVTLFEGPHWVSSAAPVVKQFELEERADIGLSWSAFETDRANTGDYVELDGDRFTPQRERGTGASENAADSHAFGSLYANTLGVDAKPFEVKRGRQEGMHRLRIATAGDNFLLGTVAVTITSDGQSG